MLPKPSRDVPELYGVNPSYSVIHSLRLAEGNFFSQSDDDSSANVCVLGEGAKVNLLGYDPAIGKSVKMNDTWLQVVGVLSEQLMAGSTNTGGAMQDVNNIVYIPLNTFQYRFWDTSASMKDDLDGIEIRLRPTPIASKSPKSSPPSSTPPTTTPRISPSPSPPPCSPSSSAPRPSSPTSWWPSPPFRCWSAASAS